MEYKNIRLIIVAVIAFTIFSVGFSITVNKSNGKVEKETESTTYVLQLSPQSTNSNNEQK